MCRRYHTRSPMLVESGLSNLGKIRIHQVQLLLGEANPMQVVMEILIQKTYTSPYDHWSPPTTEFCFVSPAPRVRNLDSDIQVGTIQQRRKFCLKSMKTRSTWPMVSPPQTAPCSSITLQHQILHPLLSLRMRRFGWPLTQIANSLKWFPKAFSHPPNNQLATSSNLRTHATVHEVHMLLNQCQGRLTRGEQGHMLAKAVVKNPRERCDISVPQRKTLLYGTKEKGKKCVKSEAEAFLLLLWTAPTAPRSTQALTTTNHILEMHQEEQLDSDAETSRLMRHYDSVSSRILLDKTEAQKVPTEYLQTHLISHPTNPGISLGYNWPERAQPVLYDADTLLHPNHHPVVQIVLWYLDSGCSRHMTGDRARLINFVEKFIGTVRFGNDEYAAIIGYGDYKLGDTIISRVYYVEGLKHNLFSVGQFCDGGLEVAFRQHSCHIRNYDMVDLLKGSRTTNLYSISLNDMMSASPHPSFIHSPVCYANTKKSLFNEDMVMASS
ncbi:hypothetical protein Tco_0462276 [Tanacetum coccineum]